MQNGATPHRTKPVFSLLNRTFHGRVPGLGYHQSMAVVSIGPLSLLILIHALISYEDF